jgi:hypothetical protein
MLLGEIEAPDGSLVGFDAGFTDKVIMELFWDANETGNQASEDQQKDAAAQIRSMLESQTLTPKTAKPVAKQLGRRGLQIFSPEERRRMVMGTKTETEEERKRRLISSTPKGRAEKALAIALHEVLWVTETGGSCPLVCSNCSDNPLPTDEDPGIPRCASKKAFGMKKIHIGMH